MWATFSVTWAQISSWVCGTGLKVRSRPEARDATGRIGPLYGFLFIFFAASCLPACSALGPATNPLHLLTRYEVAWIEPAEAIFGGNFTFFRPAADKAASGWALMFRFPDAKTTITSFQQKDRWTVAKDDSGHFLVSAKQDSGEIVDPAVSAMDAAMGVRRFNLFFEANVTAPAILTNLMPTDYIMVLNGDPRPITLAPEKDVVNMPVRADVPRQPFGPFLTGNLDADSTPQSMAGGQLAPDQALPASAEADTEPDNPSPRGTDFVGSPIGFETFIFMFGVAGSFFAVGTIDKVRWRRRYFMELKSGHPAPDVLGKNVFLDA